jgi:transcriptional regulator with XRE-family HTH domain
MIDRIFDQESAAILGRTLIQLRKRADLSQEELSSRVGIGRQALSRIEHNAENVPVGLLYRLAKELGQPVRKILKHAEKYAVAVE